MNAVELNAEGEAPIAGLYLFHFEPPYRHAGHRLGYSKDIRERVRTHLKLRSGSPLVRAALAAGSEVVVARIWPGATLALERQLHRQGGLSRHCPICRERGNYHR